MKNASPTHDTIGSESNLCFVLSFFFLPNKASSSSSERIVQRSPVVSLHAISHAGSLGGTNTRDATHSLDAKNGKAERVARAIVVVSLGSLALLMCAKPLTHRKNSVVFFSLKHT